MGSDRTARWSARANRVARLVSTNLVARGGDCGDGEEEEEEEEEEGEEGAEGTGWRGVSGRGIRPG